MATGTPGHFGGGVKGGGSESQPGKPQYDTATQTFRKQPGKPQGKPKAKPSGSKGGFAGKSSTLRPLTQQEHGQAADHLDAGGLHHAAAHHRAAAETDGGQEPNAYDGD